MTGCPHHVDFDALAPETFDSPHALFADLRARCPVAYSDSWGGFWALTRYVDVLAAATRYDSFVTSIQNVVPKVAFTGRRPPLHLDPPEHTPYRRALNPLLSERRVAGLEPVVRGYCAELLEPLIAAGHSEICADFSSRLPVLVFAEWMNLPPAEVRTLAEVGRTYNLAVQANHDELVRESSLELYEMARDLVERRKRAPLDIAEDATSALLAVRVDGEPLPEAMIIGTIRQVLVVGIIAPTVLFGSICVHLARDQDLQAQLRADPGLMPAAIEEFLRLYTPYRGFARTAVNDVAIGERTILKDEPIAIVYSSANRDETVFPDPDRFIIDRPNITDHLAFGRGPHHCPGAHLGRLQMRIALEELLARTSRFSLAGEPVQTRFPEIGAMSVPLSLHGITATSPSQGEVS